MLGGKERGCLSDRRRVIQNCDRLLRNQRHRVDFSSLARRIKGRAVHRHSAQHPEGYTYISKNILPGGDVLRLVVGVNVYPSIWAADMNVIMTTLAAQKYALLSCDHLIVCWNMSGFLMEHRIDDLERFFSAARYAASLNGSIIYRWRLLQNSRAV